MWEHFWDGFGGAISGAIIAFLGSFFAIKAQLASERKLRKQESDEKLKAILSSIYHEVKASWDEYMTGVGKALEEQKDDRLFKATRCCTGNNYVIYDANAQHIGLVNDFVLRDKIIATYILLKSLGDSYVFHNNFVNEEEEVRLKSRHIKDNETTSSLMVKQDTLASSTASIRTTHSDTKSAVEELLKLMRIYADPPQDS